jgi:hypothetical protein
MLVINLVDATNPKQVDQTGRLVKLNIYSVNFNLHRDVHYYDRSQIIYTHTHTLISSLISIFASQYYFFLLVGIFTSQYIFFLLLENIHTIIIFLLPIENIHITIFIML